MLLIKLAFFSTTMPGAGFFVTFLRKKVTKKPPDLNVVRLPELPNGRQGRASEISVSRQAGTTADFIPQKAGLIEL
ncbi:MAG: hypothetical protein KF746_22700 [Chitinophagaceae bacterium]|nr:hypothetical protein [Chitinophagaceae bacterium]